MTAPLQRRLKNVKAEADSWLGVTIQPGEYYEITSIDEFIKWSRDEKVLSDLAAGNIITNDGTRDFTNPAVAKRLLEVIRRENVSVVVSNALIQLTTYNTVGKFPWIDSRNITYRNGTALFDISVPNLSVDIRVYDSTANVVLGSLTNISTSGLYSFSFNNPSGDSRLEVQVKVNGLLGLLTPPQINSLSLEWDT